MIAVYKPHFDPVYDAPVGHRVLVWERGDPTPLHWAGVLIGVDLQADGEACWMVRDDSGLLLSLPYSEIRDWQYDDARLAEEKPCRFTSAG